MLDFVAVFRSVSIHPLHADTLGSSRNTGLCSVNVEMGSIKSGDNNHCRNALQCDHHVLRLVDGARLNFILVEEAHCPSKRTSSLAQLDVQSLSAFRLALLVRALDSSYFSCGKTLLVWVPSFIDRALDGGDLVVILVVLNDSVVGDFGHGSIERHWTPEEKRSLDEFPRLDAVVFADDSAIQERNEEDCGKHTQASTGPDGNTSNESRRLVVQLEIWAALVDNGECADGTGDEEESRRREDGPWHRILTDVDDKLDEHEDGCSEPSSNGRSHTETSEYGLESGLAM